MVRQLTPAEILERLQRVQTAFPIQTGMLAERLPISPEELRLTPFTAARIGAAQQPTGIQALQSFLGQTGQPLLAGPPPPGVGIPERLPLSFPTFPQVPEALRPTIPIQQFGLQPTPPPPVAGAPGVAGQPGGPSPADIAAFNALQSNLQNRIDALQGQIDRGIAPRTDDRVADLRGQIAELQSGIDAGTLRPREIERAEDRISQFQNQIERIQERPAEPRGDADEIQRAESRLADLQARLAGLPETAPMGFAGVAEPTPTPTPGAVPAAGTPGGIFGTAQVPGGIFGTVPLSGLPTLAGILGGPGAAGAPGEPGAEPTRLPPLGIAGAIPPPQTLAEQLEAEITRQVGTAGGAISQGVIADALNRIERSQGRFRRPSAAQNRLDFLRRLLRLPPGAARDQQLRRGGRGIPSFTPGELEVLRTVTAEQLTGIGPAIGLSERQLAGIGIPRVGA